MPPTEGEAVLAKALVNGPLLLVLMLATAAATQLIPLLVLSGAALVHGMNPIPLLWQPAPLAQIWGLMSRELLLDFLLFLPALGFFYALNAWHSSRRFAALMVVAGLAMLDRLYLTGGELVQWISRHIVPQLAARWPCSTSRPAFQSKCQFPPAIRRTSPTGCRQRFIKHGRDRCAIGSAYSPWLHWEAPRFAPRTPITAACWAPRMEPVVPWPRQVTHSASLQE